MTIGFILMRIKNKIDELIYKNVEREWKNENVFFTPGENNLRFLTIRKSRESKIVIGGGGCSAKGCCI